MTHEKTKYRWTIVYLDITRELKLSSDEKIILSIIYGFDQGYGFDGDKDYIRKLSGISEKETENALAKLASKDLIEPKYSDAEDSGYKTTETWNQLVVDAKQQKNKKHN